MIVTGEVEVWHGTNLEQTMRLRQGDFLFIPADMPHLPVNVGATAMVAVVARTDPNEQESVTLIDLPSHLTETVGRLPIASAS